MNIEEYTRARTRNSVAALLLLRRLRDGWTVDEVRPALNAIVAEDERLSAALRDIAARRVPA